MVFEVGDQWDGFVEVEVIVIGCVVVGIGDVWIVGNQIVFVVEVLEFVVWVKVVQFICGIVLVVVLYLDV